ncbi:MAG: hypothetical protein J6K58_04725 [Lachnospiraceae bacterium]|nr:hypothetical protein [Lachnospiraceae bacterium]
MDKKMKKLMELFQLLTSLLDLRISDELDELVKGLHHAISAELAVAYMYEHGYEHDGVEFVKKE